MEDLKSATAKTPLFTLKDVVCEAKCVKVYDGDTCHLVINQPGSGELRRYVCRTIGYNSAEISSKDPVEKAAAIKAKDHLSKLILDKIVKVQFYDHDRYGRMLVKIEIDGIDICSEMLSTGNGKPYSGRGEKKW